jgi:Holliday junction resolvase
MREEKVTLTIIAWLKSNGWQIVCFDFPQSGTGKVLHPNADIRESTKNKGSIIPDIIAVKDKIAVLFENKDRFVLSDFEKINELRTQNNFSNSLSTLLKNHEIENIFYGIGLPFQNSYLSKVIENQELTDFIVFIDETNQIQTGYDTKDVFTVSSR